MSSILQQIDLAQQTKLGEAFALRLDAGGTGRVDGRSQGTIQTCVSTGSITQYAPVKMDPRATVGDSVLVTAITAGSDRVLGIALESVGAFEEVPVLVQGVTLALITGSITAGDYLYPASSGRLSPTVTSSPAVAQALNSSSGDQANYILLADAGIAALTTQVFTFPFIMDNGGLALTTGLKGVLGPFDFPMNIERWSLLADQSGSIVVDLFKCTYAAYDPPTHPVSGDKITASLPPTISSAKKAQSSTLTGWTTLLSVDDVLAVNINSISVIQRCTLSLKMRRA